MTEQASTLRSSELSSPPPHPMPMTPDQTSQPLPPSKPSQFPIGDTVAINGTVFALVETATAFTVGSQIDSPTWVECEVVKTVERNGIQAQILLGDWEGEGGLRLANSVSEVVLHFDASESFQDIQLFPDRLQASIDEYPTQGAYEVHFQLDDQLQIQVLKITHSQIMETIPDDRHEQNHRPSPPMKKLQPLRVPAGWTISYNQFHECDASDPDSSDHLTEDLYQAFNEQHDQLLDIGWYGSIEEGAFGLTLVQHDFRGPELAKYNSRNRQEIVLMAEEWMANPGSHLKNPFAEG